MVAFLPAASGGGHDEMLVWVGACDGAGGWVGRGGWEVEGGGFGGRGGWVEGKGGCVMGGWG
jgi:hypothetical protein